MMFMLWCACTAVCVGLIITVAAQYMRISQAHTNADAIALAYVLGGSSSAQTLATITGARIESANEDNGGVITVVVQSEGVRIQAQASR
jgi:hypothetical protein